MIFQFTSKKIISLLACISITISCLVIPASAAVTPGQVIEGIGTIATLWDIGNDAYEMWQELNPDKDPSEYPGFNPGGSFSGAGGSRDDAIARYEEYVNGLQTDLGTTILSDGSIRYYFTSSALDETQNWDSLPGSFGQITTIDNWLVPGPSIRIRITYNTSGSKEGAIKAPTDGSYSTGYICSSSAVRSASNEIENKNVTKDTYFLPSKDSMFRYFMVEGMNDVFFSTAIIVYADFTPLNGISSVTGQDITINSRPSSIVGDYGIMGDDGSIVKVEGGSLVNESEKLVYSPTTAGEITYTDCVFDYADRSYTLTLEDGSTMKVVYGDENVTIHEGDTIYNVYYLSSDSGSGGSGSDGGGSGDGSVGDAVSGLLGGLGNILAGLIEGLLKMAAQAVEALGGLIDIFNGLVDMILGFFSGFTGFLGSMFPFLPEETFVILNFGLILLIAAAVIKKLFL